MASSSDRPYRPPHLRVRYHEGGGIDEVLGPTRMFVEDGRCYRKVNFSFGNARGTHLNWSNSGTNFSDDHYDEGEENAVELDGVERSPGGGGFVLRMNIPSNFYKYIIGRQGNTKTSIERETKCRIKIPPRGVEGDVVIESEGVPCISDAKRRLEIVMWSNRLKEPVTHFICIPLNHPIVMAKVEDFKQQVLKVCSKDRGISEDIFQIPAKFHVTVGVVRLFTKEEEEKAMSVLEECLIKAREHLGSETAMITLSGVDSMKDDPSAVDVLYAKVLPKDSSDRLQKFVDTVVSCFLEKAPDLMTREFERVGVKLHATLLNSKFKGSSETVYGKGTYKARGSRESFDARGIIKEFGEFEFGEIPLQYIHLSKRGEYGPDGFYTCIKQYSIETITCG